MFKDITLPVSVLTLKLTSVPVSSQEKGLIIRMRLETTFTCSCSAERGVSSSIRLISLFRFGLEMLDAGSESQQLTPTNVVDDDPKPEVVGVVDEVKREEKGEGAPGAPSNPNVEGTGPAAPEVVELDCEKGEVGNGLDEKGAKSKQEDAGDSPEKILPPAPKPG